MKCWQMQNLGDPWDLLEAVDIQIEEVPAGTCQIEVIATDLNFADILQCQGTYQVKLEPPFTPGMNAVGRVIAVGEGTRFKPGDLVVGPCYKGWGGYAQECLIAADRATAIPAGVDPLQAVAMNVTYGTAWFGLHLRGNLQPGESVLVLAGAGGVGSAAIDLARVHGCYVIAAAGGKNKTDACLAMGADEIVDYNSEDLYERVMALTDGRGVDVVYDPVGGDYFDVARRLVAWEGRLLIIGFASGRIPTAPMNHALVKNYSIVGVHMGGYRGRDNAAFDRCYSELFELLKEGRIKPLVDETIGFDQLPETLLKLANRETKGRVIFDPSA
jgi:NADPH2:quinone reductase